MQKQNMPEVILDFTMLKAEVEKQDPICDTNDSSFYRPQGVNKALPSPCDIYIAQTKVNSYRNRSQTETTTYDDYPF